MVKLNKIYTRTGDAGMTGLGTGERRRKDDLRVEAYGTVDEANSCIGLARAFLSDLPAGVGVAESLVSVQNDLFDLGADLCVPETEGEKECLRIRQSQIDWLERKIDELNADLPALRSFVLPGGTQAAAALHIARSVVRRAERLMVALAAAPDEKLGEPALKYINRLSDFLFVAARYINSRTVGDTLWEQDRPR
ncbi:MAG: cob(I)yrinic acid a,c-diamide adenosyltransferase [Beijerinckiaceae bacterium]|nr:MAG: cob(I)yrinic acid a,c-diamide adenosyltransferase [Beijerinckiaceae bacterium]